MKRGLLLLFILSAIILNSCQKTKVRTGYDVLELMYNEHHGNWFRHMTFEQEVEYFKGNQRYKIETWFEAYSATGNLVVKKNGLDSCSGWLFSKGHMYTMKNCHPIKEESRIHDLVLLGYDVYHQPIKKSTFELLRLKYNMDEVKDTIWNNRHVYIIGKLKPGDYTQIIIDKEQLLYLSSIKKEKGIKRQIRFRNFQEVDGYMIATQVDFMKDDELRLRETYKNIKFPDTIDMSIYEPQNFKKARW